MRYIHVTHAKGKCWLERIATFEKSIRYPYGRDFFSIDHGEDYLAFFNRLGKPHYLVAGQDEKPAAMACGVLRNLDGTKVWYLGDLKVDPAYRGRRLPAKLFIQGALRWAWAQRSTS